MDLTPFSAIRWWKYTVPVSGLTIVLAVASTVPVTYVVLGLLATTWIVSMSSSSTPSLGVVSVTINAPGPWSVNVHVSPWRSRPVK